MGGEETDWANDLGGDVAGRQDDDDLKFDFPMSVVLRLDKTVDASESTMSEPNDFESS